VSLVIKCNIRCFYQPISKKWLVVVGGCARVVEGGATWVCVEVVDGGGNIRFKAFSVSFVGRLKAKTI
jgi:hypothetical protein